MIKLKLPFKISGYLKTFAEKESDFEDFDFVKLFFKGNEKDIMKIYEGLIEDTSNFIEFVDKCKSIEELLLKTYFLGVFMDKLITLFIIEEIGTEKFREIIEDFFCKILKISKENLRKEVKQFLNFGNLSSKDLML